MEFDVEKFHKYSVVCMDNRLYFAEVITQLVLASSRCLRRQRLYAKLLRAAMPLI